MWRVFWTGAGACGAMVALLIWASTQVVFLFRHPATKGMRIEIDKQTGAAVAMQPVSLRTVSAAAAGTPRAETDQIEHDFGVMDPLTMGRHDFFIRNGGNGPLHLRVGPTSCKCTLSGLARSDVPPGEATTVTLQWNTGRDLHYAHVGTIYTNDPLRPAIEFGVRGKVRLALGFDEPEIHIERLNTDQPTIVERFVYSQMWEKFTIQDVQTGIAGLTWEATPLDPGEVTHDQATAVQRLLLTIPAALPAGQVQDTLRLRVQCGDEGEIRCLDLPLTAAVMRRLAFYGAAIDDTGLIDLGDTPAGTAKRVKLLAKVRDPELDLSGAKIDIFPPFLKAELTPRRGEKAGLYDLTVEVPGDAASCQYHSTPLGRLTIDTGHPRIGKVELPVTFAVVPWRTP